MSKKTNFKKNKIIQFKDVISLLLIAVIILFPLSCVWGAGLFTNIYNWYTAKPDSTVTARELAMFAAISNVNLENIDEYKNITHVKDTYYNSNTISSSNSSNVITSFVSTSLNNLIYGEMDMVTTAQLLKTNIDASLCGINLNNRKNAYSFLFNDLASTYEVVDWKIINYTKFNTTDTSEFSAMTFKKDNNIVIAYRSTNIELNTIYEDLSGLLEQKDVAMNYALAIAKRYPDSNISLTGWSFGGYFAQLGGAALVGNDEYKDNVKEISYFNSVGLDFYSDIIETINEIETKINSIDSIISIKDKLDQFKDTFTKLKTLDIDKSSDEDYDDLLKKWIWHDNGFIKSYQIRGDIISSFGKHVGKQELKDAYTLCIRDNNGYDLASSNNLLGNMAKNAIRDLLDSILPTKLTRYFEEYGLDNYTDYFRVTHKIDNFFGLLEYRDGTPPPNIEVFFSGVPNTLKKKKSTTIELIINSYNSPLQSTDLDKSDFKVSNLELTNIVLTETKEKDNYYEYIYELTIKGGSSTSKDATIELKDKALSITPLDSVNYNYNIEKKFNTLTTYVVTSDPIDITILNKK